MKEPTVIQSSKLRVAGVHMIWACFGLVWPALYIFTIHPANHIGAVFKVLFALCALASGAIALSAARRAWRVLRTPGAWKATIASGRLVWDAAIPSENLPLEIVLESVAKTLRLETSRTGKDSDGEYTETREFFELHVTDGRILHLDPDDTGINPHRVFLALAKHGVRYELWSQDCTKGSLNTSRVLQSTY